MSTSEKGHLNPLTAVAERLRRGGHEVGWLTIPEPTPELARLGVENFGLEGAPEGPRLATGGEALARIVSDPEALGSWIQQLLLDAVPNQIDPVRRLLARFGPHAVGLDPMLYQGVIACHLESIPYAGISSSLNPVTPEWLDCELTRTVARLASRRAELFSRHGLSPAFKVCDCLSPYLNTVFTTAAYVGEAESLPPHTYLVGPSVPEGRRGDESEFPWERLRPERPLVYVSFGSQIYWQPLLFQRVVEAAASLEVQVVLSAGKLAGTEWRKALPEEVIVREYVPQPALLKRAALFVTHGGANSVMEALYAGVPLAIHPICNDQFLQAHFVEKSGVGVRVDLQQGSLAWIRETLRKLLEPDSTAREAARRIQTSYRQAGGAGEVAERLAALARS
jgi:MGT family glycosyltransferase